MGAMRGRQWKKKKDNDNDDPAPPSQLYTVDGEHFFQSRAELDRHLSGKYRKAKPAADSQKRKEERVAKKKAAIEAARAAALDLAHLAIAMGGAHDRLHLERRSFEPKRLGPKWLRSPCMHGLRLKLRLTLMLITR